MVAGIEDEALEQGLKELIGAGFLYEAEIYPERVLAFSHPLTQEVAYGSQLGEQRASAHAATAQAMIELNPDRHDELAALIAQHLEQGGETLEAARWYARAAHRAGNSHPQEAMRLWGRVTDLASELPESEETLALGVFSRLLQLDYAWRLGMEKDRVDSLVEEAREIAAKSGDLRSLTMLRLLESARPGLVQPAADWTRASDEAVALADESGDDALRVAIRTAGSYAYLCAGDNDQCERLLDEALAIAGDDHSAGNGIVIGCPYAWALMAQACITRDRGDYDAGEKLFEQALRIAADQGDPETESWSRGNLAVLFALRGDPDAALGLAQRNYELTERLGDVFSRHWALLHLGFVQLQRGDAQEALGSLERADSVYREAMATGGEVEAWREALIAEALLAVGRKAEALEHAEHAVTIAKERGLLWSLSRGLRVFAEARIAAGEPGAGELFDEAERVARASGQAVELQEIERARNAAPAAQT
jgi:adenylate cyclase